MKTNKKDMYLAPEVDIFDVKTEGTICTGSVKKPDDYNNGGDPFGF